ncbi:triosephosphate isomerase [Paenibacillaceae bacterium GAS479]|nr:triosephosphate isomerase [Paenibacillaceae bacterium GAS479]
MKPMILGSGWKMFLTDSEALAHAEAIAAFGTESQGVELFVLPSFTALHRVTERLAGCGIHVGAQNLAWAEKGAFTGEVSVLSLKELGVTHAEIGHTERRELFGETVETIARKLHTALEHGMTPVYCFGENAAEKRDGRTERVLADEFRKTLRGICFEEAQRIIFAYEPVWAIGVAESAEPADVNPIIGSLRSVLAELYPTSKDGAEFRIVYGGSVNLDNFPKLLEQPHIDGLFVGRASLVPESYAEMVRQMTRRAAERQ